MNAYTKNYKEVLNVLNSSESGLNNSLVKESRQKFGSNVIKKPKSKSLFKRIIEALFDPMLIILEIAMVITLGINFGKLLSGNECDFYECIGIVLSIIISVALTVVMEGKSKKAFETLNKISENALIKVKRNNQVVLISQKDVVVGDVIILESGDKIIADGRLILSNELKVDESTLTGESRPVYKNSEIVLPIKTPLAEQKNMLFSGSFVVAGGGEMVVTAVGESAEIGLIAKDLQVKDAVSAPLQEKLDRLGKLVASLGIISAVFVLILSVTRLFMANNVSFYTIEEAFLNSIILIVASVPEGLPTTVAIALSLNVVKLFKSNALIKKLVAAETVGCVSVICSDKTGTITENKMKVNYVSSKSEVYNTVNDIDENIILNISLNSTSIIGKNEIGQATELALLKYVSKNYDYIELRNIYKTIKRVPFSSENKYMATTVNKDNKNVTFIKGAPEVIIKNSNMTNEEKTKLLAKISKEQKNLKRVICFARSYDGTLNNVVCDGYSVISDVIRKDVYQSILECKNAGIKVKMLTGDNLETAFSIAKELKIASRDDEVVNAYDLEEMSDEELKKLLGRIKVVARSTPKLKLRIVNLLKEMGEVVAVTGDGVNDAPAIKNADIGIAMGAGSEVTKEASDIVLLDNSFSTIIKAISFGRNIYQNFQRFITFQLSVNVTAVLFIIVSLVLGYEPPFTTVELLWVNIIMDGPPALTLGLESRGYELMNNKPVKRTNNILSKKMLIRVFLHAVIICATLALQKKYNFIGCNGSEMETVLFNMFIIFQLFNAFNCRELGSKSALNEIKNNKLMLIVFGVTFILQILFSELFKNFFGTVNLDFVIWVKIVLTCLIIVVISEAYKLIYRIFTRSQKISIKLRKSFN